MGGLPDLSFIFVFLKSNTPIVLFITQMLSCDFILHKCESNICFQADVSQVIISIIIIIIIITIIIFFVKDNINGPEQAHNLEWKNFNNIYLKGLAKQIKSYK